MVGALVVIGVAIEVAARRMVARGRVNTWLGMTLAFAILAGISLASGEVHLSPEQSAGSATIVGLLAAFVFFAGTRVFLRVTVGWERFQRDSESLYSESGPLPMPAELALGAAVACGEEIFWRGLVLQWAQSRWGTAAGAVAALVGYAAASAAAASVPVVVGAAVGGVLWTSLAVWSGGVLAGMVCHATWTMLMIAFPFSAHPGKSQDPT